MNAYTLTLTEEEQQVFDRSINGQGGSQTLLRRLHSCTTDGRRLIVAPELLDRSYRYAYRYARSGGFQGRFRAVVKAAMRAGWHPARQVVVERTRAA